jgi:ribonucleotide reductase alpha subunit
LTPYEVCAAKWNIETLKALIFAIDKGDAQEADKSGSENRQNFFSVNVLKKGLILAIEEGNFIENKDLSLLDIIINQIKIQYMVDSSKIISL